MSITFLQLAQKVLAEEKRPLSATEMWEVAQAKGYDKEVGTRGKTPWATLGALLYVDVRDNSDTVFVTTSTRPKRFVLRSLVDSLGIKDLNASQPSIPKQKKAEYEEKALHPLLVLILRPNFSGGSELSWYAIYRQMENVAPHIRCFLSGGRAYSSHKGIAHKLSTLTTCQEEVLGRFG